VVEDVGNIQRRCGSLTVCKEEERRGGEDTGENNSNCGFRLRPNRAIKGDLVEAAMVVTRAQLVPPQLPKSWRKNRFLL